VIRVLLGFPSQGHGSHQHREIDAAISHAESQAARIRNAEALEDFFVRVKVSNDELVQRF
jgi:hypothetical protein